MDINSFLSRLQKVTKHGKGWKACCPAHDDSSPSFTIKVADNGAIVFHCFAGCEPEEVVKSLGIEFSDLFPDEFDKSSYARQKREQVIEHEKNILRIAKADKAKGVVHSQLDLNRIKLAMARVKGALWE